MNQFEFTQVTEQHERILIVCSGLSAKGFTPPPGVTVIAVNGAIEWIDRADYFFTLDLSPVNVKRMQDQREGVKYYCAAPVNVGREDAPSVQMRKLTPNDLPNVHFLLREKGNGPMKAKYGLSIDPRRIHTGNSGYGALGLAYLMKAQRIMFVGLDGDRLKVEGGLSHNLRHLPQIFESTVPQVLNMVKVANPNSRVKCFDRCTIDEGLKWLTQ